MNIEEIRLERLKSLIKEHGQTNLSKTLGYAQSSFLSQMTGANPQRSITEKTARRFEEKLGLPRGWFDTREDLPAPTSSAADPNTVDLVADVIRMVGTLAQEEQVDLPPLKFADVVAMAYVDTMEHGQQPRPEHIKRLVRLLK